MPNKNLMESIAFYEIRRKMKQIKLFITKKGYKTDTLGNKIESTLLARPCAECFKLMQYYGIKKVYYTLDGGNIVSINVNKIDITEEFVSDAQKCFFNDKHWIT